MAELTDQEIVAACARVMGLLPYMNPPELTQHGMAVERLISGGVHSSSQQFFYNPLTDRAQAMELVEKLGMSIEFDDEMKTWFASQWSDSNVCIEDANLLRAVCLCAAEKQKARKGT